MSTNLKTPLYIKRSDLHLSHEIEMESYTNHVQREYWSATFSGNVYSDIPQGQRLHEITFTRVGGDYNDLLKEVGDYVNSLGLTFYAEGPLRV